MDGVRKKSLRELLPKDEFDAPAQKPPRKKKNSVDTATYFEEKRNLKGSSMLVWACLIIILAVGGYYLSTIFSSVTVAVEPKTTDVTLTGQYEAAKAPSLGIEYSVMKIEDSSSKIVPATGKEKVETKAKGKVTIYNNFSNTAQKLVANTRLETSDGLIFRLDQAVSIPGSTGKTGNITPGQVSVNVTADKTGDSYNLSNVDLKIVGYKGTDKYQKITAKLSSSSGGASGEVYSVEPAEKEKIVKELGDKLTVELKENAHKQIPKNSIIFDEGLFVTLSTEVQNSGSSSSTAKIVVKGTLIGLLFDGEKFSQYFAKKAVAEGETDGIEFASLDKVKFELLSDKNVIQSDKISFKLAGDSKLIWPIDEESLRGKLTGAAIKDDSKVFSQFPNIFKAKSVVRPPWLVSFPSDPEKIKIVVSGV